MRVLFLTTHLNTGGITSYLLTLSKGLIKKGHHVHIAASGGNREEDFRNLGASVLNLDIKTKSELNPKIYLALRSLKKYTIEQKIDVIHSHTRVTQVMGRLLQKTTGRAFVSTCHGFFKPKFSRRIFPCWGDGVIAISPAVKDHLINDFHVAKEKVFVVENGLDFESFPMIDELTKERARQKQIGRASCRERVCQYV